jgi:hypothetical protein
MPGAANSTVALKAGVTPVSAGLRSDSPWLRAAIIAPSASSFLTASRLGPVDPRWQAELLRKPAQSVMMVFSADPHLGMRADRFTGSAVVFVATMTFTSTQTASLPPRMIGGLY